ncbi:MAG: glycosyltransferase [Mycobacterium sp.]|nr:glycosyltransferase [Mycobacterium sp.]
MKVLVVNKFLHHLGGVETYVDWLGSNLDRIGIETHFFGMEPPEGRELMSSIAGRVTCTPNREFNGSKLSAAKSALTSVYSPVTERMLEATIASFKPDLVHFHSTCRQLTPSVARAFTESGLPGVLTTHEYKQVCATQRLWDERRNRVCTACLTGSAFSRMTNVATRRCVRGSTVASMFAIPEIPIADHFWGKSGVIIHAPSRFIGRVMEDAPYIPNRVHVLDLPWGEPVTRVATEGWERRAIYVGRLQREKGVDVLLAAWKIIEDRYRDAELIVAGGGSEQYALQEQAEVLGLKRVRFTGRYERSALGELFGQVAVSVHPSLWHENSPFTVRESLLHAVPAIVTAVGGMPEMVDDDSGSVVPPGDPLAIANAITAEFTRRSAGSPPLLQSVAKRAMSDTSHLNGLEVLYGAAAERISS